MKKSKEFKNDIFFRCFLLLFLVFCVALSFPKASEAKMVALVIGNAAYESATDLRNPHNDAVGVTSALRQIGFDVGNSPVLDADNAHLRAAVGSFRRQSVGAEIALIYYAGHAIQFENENYIIPVDSVLRDVGDIDLHTISLRAVLNQMRGDVNIVILDACRDNPFSERLQLAGASLGRGISTGRGLARIDARTLSGGSFIAMSAGPNSIADDGSGSHSPYTEALLEHIGTPELPVRLLFARVRETVEARTRGGQRPEAIDRLPSRPIFLGTFGSAPLGGDGVACTDLRLAGTPAAAQTYLDLFPNGKCAAEAWALIPEDRGGDGSTDGGSLLTETGKAVEEALHLTRSDWRAIQRGLAGLGFRPGPVDGVPGKETRAAVERWQRATGVEPPTFGYLTAEAVSQLRKAGGTATADSQRAVWEALIRARTGGETGQSGGDDRQDRGAPGPLDAESVVDEWTRQLQQRGALK